MDEALFSVLEQISGILSGYVAGVRASAHINDAPKIPPQTTLPSEQRSRKSNVIQFVPKNLKNNYVLKSDKANVKEVFEDMPCQFSDGSFRVMNQKGRLQYRFQFRKEQVSVYGDTKQECWEKRLEYMKNPPERRKHCITYEQWAQKWLESYKRGMVESAYFKSIQSHLKNHIFPKIGEKDVKRITSLDLQDLLQSIPTDNVRTKCATIVGESFRTAKVCGLIDKNPYEGVKIKRYQQPELGAMSHVQQKQLLKYIDERMPGTEMNDFIRALLFSGMRQSELNALRVENIDFDNMLITIDSAWKRDTHTAGKTKTKRGKRKMPMAQPLADLLKRRCADKAQSERLFGFDSQEYTYRMISDVFRALGMPFTGHILRHTFITNAYEFGFPQYLVQRWVGHASFDEDNVYLSLRTASNFCETEVTAYMRTLKKMTVLAVY